MIVVIIGIILAGIWYFWLYTLSTQGPDYSTGNRRQEDILVVGGVSSSFSSPNYAHSGGRQWVRRSEAIRRHERYFAPVTSSSSRFHGISTISGERKGPLLPSYSKSYNVRNSDYTPTPTFSHLLIATDATPYHVGGYCIDFETQSCYYYSFPIGLLPKCFKVSGRGCHPAEFEMNNLAFALLHWEPKILERRRLSLFTDNNAIRINGVRPEYGEGVTAYLNHLENCCYVTLLNKGRYHLNKNFRQDEFDKYIVPADHLSRKRILAFKEKIKSSFPNVREFCRIISAAEQVQERWDYYCRQPCCRRVKYSSRERDNAEFINRMIR